jgi:hypothetical protein
MLSHVRRVDSAGTSSQDPGVGATAGATGQGASRQPEGVWRPPDAPIRRALTEPRTQLNDRDAMHRGPVGARLWHLLQLRPRQSLPPGGLELHLGLLQGRHPIGACHRTGDGEPEPAQTIRATEVESDDGGFGGEVERSAQPFRQFVNLAQKRAPDSSSTASQMVIPSPVVNIIASRRRLVGVEQADSEIDVAS